MKVWRLYVIEVSLRVFLLNYLGKSAWAIFNRGFMCLSFKLLVKSGNL